MKLLYIEWLKLKNYKTFWMLVGLFAGLFLLLNYGLSVNTVTFEGGRVSFLSKSYAFPNVWENMGFIYGCFVFFLVVFMIISISNEYTFRTQRQHIIDGMNRLDFLNSKILLVLSMSVFATLFYYIATLIFGFANGGGNPFDGNIKILHVFLYTLNYISFGALVALFVKRSGLSIILFLAYLILESIICNAVNFKFKTAYGAMLPLQSSDELLPLPVMKTIGSMVPEAMQPEANPWVCVFASVIYIALYYVLARRKMQTADL